MSNVKLVVDGTEYEMPVLESTLGRPVLDVSAVAKAGFWTYDPGFMATAPVESTSLLTSTSLYKTRLIASCFV